MTFDQVLDETSQHAAVLEDLRRRLGETLEGGAPEVGDLRPLEGGHSGDTYVLRVADRVGILRLSPRGRRIAGPADVGRQGRIMAALGRAGAPVPGIVDFSSEPIIDGRAFVLMERDPGLTWREARRGMTDAELVAAALEAVKCVHAVPSELTGIGEEPAFGPAEEVERWTALLERAPAALRPGTEDLAAALAADAPARTSPCLAHGDFHFANLLYRDGRVSAVLDWEIAALSDPLVDVACLAVASIRRRYRPEPNPTGDVDVTPREIGDRYGADPERLAWFCAQSCLKYAAIIGYNLDLHRRGKRSDAIYERLERTMLGLPADGLAFLRHGLDGVTRTLEGRRA